MTSCQHRACRSRWPCAAAGCFSCPGRWPRTRPPVLYRKPAGPASAVRSTLPMSVIASFPPSRLAPRMSRTALADHPKFLSGSVALVIALAPRNTGTAVRRGRRSRRHHQPRHTEPADLRCRLSRSRSDTSSSVDDRMLRPRISMRCPGCCRRSQRSSVQPPRPAGSTPNADSRAVGGFGGRVPIGAGWNILRRGLVAATFSSRCHRSPRTRPGAWSDLFASARRHQQLHPGR